MSEAWFGFLGVIVGAVVAGVISLLREQLAFKRERAARLEERELARRDRRDDFERETLLAVQDALSVMRQAVFRDEERKMAALAAHGAWPVRSPGTVLPADWAEADERLSRLLARIFDDELQEQVEHFREASGLAMTAQDQASASSWVTAASTSLDEANARVGVLLARLF